MDGVGTYISKAGEASRPASNMKMDTENTLDLPSAYTSYPKSSPHRQPSQPVQPADPTMELIDEYFD